MKKLTKTSRNNENILREEHPLAASDILKLMKRMNITDT